MTQQEWTNRPPARQRESDDTIDIEMLAQAVWRRRWMVAAITLLGGLLGVGASILGTRFLSSGLLLTPGVSIADFKRYEAAMENLPRLEQFLEASGKDGQAAAGLMRDLVLEAGAMSAAVRPEFSFTDRDAKLFGVKEERASKLVGIELVLRQQEPLEEAPVLLLADYVRDTAIIVDLESVIPKACVDNEMRQQELRNEQLESEFQIGQLEARAAQLREIIARIPDAGIEVRQVVSLENGGDRFLPPATQLAATEIGIADRRIDEVRRQRDRVAAEINRDYYCEARKMLASGSSGRDLLLSLPGLQQQVLAGKDMKVNVVEQTANALELESRRWVNRYLEQMRFVASPQGAQMLERKPGRAVGAAFGLTLGALLGAARAIALAWWRRHRDGIVSGDER